MGRTACVLLLLAALCLSAVGCQPKRARGNVSVGASGDRFTLLAGTLLVHALRQEGYAVQFRTEYPSMREVRNALLLGDIDLAWFETAETWFKLLGHDLPIHDAEKLAQAIAEEDSRNDLTWLSPAPYPLKPGLVMRESDLGKMRLSRMSELAAYEAKSTPYTLCFSNDFLVPGTSIQGMQRAYDLQIPQQRLLSTDSSELFNRLLQGECNLAMAYSVAAAAVPEVRFIEDDKQYLQASGYALAARDALISEYPDILRILTRVNGWLTPQTVSLLYKQLDEGAPVDEVALQYVRQRKTN